MKKTKLVVDFEYDFELIGITSSTKFHKLCWSINNGIGLRLIKQEDFVLESVEGREMTFVNYAHVDDSCEIIVFKNKSPDNDSDLILPEMPHFDYVLKINGSFQTFAVEEVIKQLRDVKYIEYIAPIALEKLKSKDNFLN